MRILFVVPSYHPATAYGGPVESVLQLNRHLARIGHEVEVLTTDANGLDARLDVPREWRPEARMRVRYMPRVARHSVSPALVRALPRAASDADVVHLTGVYSFPTFPTLAAARAARVPLVWSPRGSLQRWDGTRRPAAKAAWERAARALVPRRAALHVTSQQEAEESAARMPGMRIALVPNGIEIPAPAPRPAASDELRLLFLGRLDPIKGLENLLDAIAGAAKAGVRTSLVVAGAGAPGYERDLRARAARLGIADRVAFVGHVAGDAREACFAQADVLVLPSHRENFGMVALEALARGVPVVATRGTPWSGLEQERCGLWVESAPDALAAALSDLRAMPLVAMGARGRAWAERDFGWEPIARRMADVYASVQGARA